MHALTVKQPWAEAIARHGKSVENRTRRPPAHLIGQRVSIHVGKTWPNDGELWSAMEGVKQHCPDLFEWNYQHRELRFQRLPSPHAGRIIATARLVGWRTVDQFCPGEGHADGVLTEAAKRSPWFTGPVGWVLADVRPLAVPVGMYGACGAPRGIGGGHVPCGDCGHMMLEHGSIRGQPYPFALSPEVEAAVLRQESGNVG